MHHPDHATLLSYAGGSLDETFATVVSAHLSWCEECRGRIRALEFVGGTALDRVSRTPMKPGSLERIMTRLDEPEPESPRSGAEPDDAAGLPRTLSRLIGPLDRVPWKTVAPGIATRRIPVSAGARGSLILMRIAPGRKVPEHGHGGTELTLILSGSYRDSLGRFRPGDIADLDEEVEHQPVVDSEQPCICLVATESPTRFKGFFSRLLQPLVGI